MEFMGVQHAANPGSFYYEGTCYAGHHCIERTGQTCLAAIYLTQPCDFASNEYYAKPIG